MAGSRHAHIDSGASAVPKLPLHRDASTSVAGGGAAEPHKPPKMKLWQPGYHPRKAVAPRAYPHALQPLEYDKDGVGYHPRTRPQTAPGHNPSPPHLRPGGGPMPDGYVSRPSTSRSTAPPRSLSPQYDTRRRSESQAFWTAAGRSRNPSPPLAPALAFGQANTSEPRFPSPHDRATALFNLTGQPVGAASPEGRASTNSRPQSAFFSALEGYQSGTAGMHPAPHASSGGAYRPSTASGRPRTAASRAQSAASGGALSARSQQDGRHESSQSPLPSRPLPVAQHTTGVLRVSADGGLASLSSATDLAAARRDADADTMLDASAWGGGSSSAAGVGWAPTHGGSAPGTAPGTARAGGAGGEPLGREGSAGFAGEPLIGPSLPSGLERVNMYTSTQGHGSAGFNSPRSTATGAGPFGALGSAAPGLKPVPDLTLSMIPPEAHVIEAMPLKPEADGRYQVIYSDRDRMWLRTKFPALQPTDRRDVSLLEEFYDRQVSAIQSDVEAEADAEASEGADGGAGAGAGAGRARDEFDGFAPDGETRLVRFLNRSVDLGTVCMHELARQSAMYCRERGLLTMKIWMENAEALKRVIAVAGRCKLETLRMVGERAQMRAEKEQVSALEATFKAGLEHADKLARKVGELQSDVDERRADQRALNVRVSALEAQLASCREECERLAASNKWANNKLAGMVPAENLEEATMINEMLKENVHNANEEIDRLRHLVDDKEGTAQRIAAELAQLKREHHTLRLTQAATERALAERTARPRWDDLESSGLLPDDITSRDAAELFDKKIQELEADMGLLLQRLNEPPPPPPPPRYRRNSMASRQFAFITDPEFILCEANHKHKFLRFNGKVKNRQLTLDQVRMLILDVWGSKLLDPGTKTMKLADYFLLYLQRKYGGLPPVIADWGYNMTAAARRYMAADTYCGMFLQVLEGETDEDFFVDWYATLQRLRTYMAQIDKMEGGTLTHTLKRKDFMSAIRKFFPYKTPDRLEMLGSALTHACLAENPAAGDAAAGDLYDVPYGDVLGREDTQGAAVAPPTELTLALVRQSYEEKEEYALEIYHRLHQVDMHRHGMLAAKQFRRSLKETDPLKSDSELRSYMMRGFSHEANEEVDDEEMISIEEFMRNLRRGVLKRSDPKSHWATGVKAVTAAARLTMAGALKGHGSFVRG